MFAILVQQPGKASRLVISETPKPEPKPTEVLIRVRAAGVNRADLLQRRGLYPPPEGASEILGLECCGIVEAVGADVHDIPIGQRVMALLAGGGYAQYTVADAGCVLPAPDSFSDEEAGAFPEVFATAYLNLFELGHARAGDWVLIHGGSGGVGTAAISLCRQAGVRTIVTVGSSEKRDSALQLGADVAVIHQTESFLDAVAQSTHGNGVAVVLDCIGAPYLADHVACLAMDGRLVVIGLLGGRRAEIDLALVLKKRLRIIGSTLRNLSNRRKATIMLELQNRLRAQPALQKPVIFRPWDWQDVEGAHACMQNSAHFGKIVLKIA